MILNFDSIKDLVLDNRSEKINIDQLKFKRDKHTWNVYTEIIEKQYGFVYDKRIIKDVLSTLPDVY